VSYQEPPIQCFKLKERGLQHIFGELEARLMEAVWALDKPAVRQVIDYYGGNLNYKTTMTVLNRLVRKGILQRHKAGRAFVYSATTSREELLATVFDQIGRSMFEEEFRYIALKQMIETAESMDPEILDEITALIEQTKTKQGKTWSR